MAKIKSKITGDVFEAPAADFQNEADFEIVDDSTPVTTDTVPGNALTDGAASETAPSDTSGTTDSTIGTSSATDMALPATPAETSAAASTPAASGDDAGNAAPVAPAPDASASGWVTGADVGNVVASGDSTTTARGAAVSDASQQPAVSGDVGNVDASAGADVSTAAEDPALSAPAPVADTAAADAATPLDPIIPPVTDSVTGAPTGGPTAGRGATLDSKGKHIVADQIESSVLYALAQLVDVTDDLKHAADAFFDQVRSRIDVEAADAQ